MRWMAGLILVLVISACTDNTKIPDGIIRQQKMEKIFWDMLQADRFVNTYVLNTKDSLPVRKKEAAIFYERVFQMNGISFCLLISAVSPQ